MDSSELTQANAAYNLSANRLIVLDHRTITGGRTDDISLRLFLSRILNEGRNDLVVISGKTTERLDDFYPELQLTLAAENGGFIRGFGDRWLPTVNASPLWREPLRKALKTLVHSYERSSLEEKYFSFAWHYQSSESFSGSEKEQIFTGLRALARQFDLHIKESDDTVELGVSSVSREKFISDWLVKHGPYDFILAAGSSREDEGLFDLLKGSFTICAGCGAGTTARFRIRGQSEVLPTLNRIVAGEALL